MIRINIQLTETQALALEKIAVEQGESIETLVHNSIDRLLQEAEQSLRTPEEQWQGALSVVGKFRSGVPDLAANHDEYYVQAIEESLRHKRKNFEEQGFTCIP